MDAMLKNGVFSPRSSHLFGMDDMAVATLGSSLLGAGSSIFGGAMTRRATKEYNKGQMEIAQMNNEWNANEALKNREWQEQMVASQNQWNLEQWNRENEYNSPVAQRQRLEAAGLNPYMMMDGGSAGSASSVSAASPSGGATASPAQMPQQQALKYDFNSVGQAINSYFQNRMILSQLANVDADTSGKNLNNAIVEQFGSDMAIAKISANLRGDWSQLDPKVRSYIASQGMERAQLGMEGLRRKVQGAGIINEMNEAETYNLKLRGETARIYNEYFPANLKADLQIKAQKFNNMVLEGQLTETQAQKNLQDIVESEARTLGIKLDYEISRDISKTFVNKENMKNLHEFDVYNAANAYMYDERYMTHMLQRFAFDISKQEHGWRTNWRGRLSHYELPLLQQFLNLRNSYYDPALRALGSLRR